MATFGTNTFKGIMADTAANALVVYFPFVNGRYYATMPLDGFLTTVKYKFWSPGGGGGGWDSQPGGEGAGGAYVEGTYTVRPGQLIEVFVGQGGGPGTGGGGAAGGYNGKSNTGFSGGRGGNSGTSGYSGSGGGGGGATLMRVDNLIVAIAGGGGGGGGGGASGAGASASNTFTPGVKSYAITDDQCKGVAGGDHPGDGGGGGGGGAGIAGGEGGAEGSGDVGGGAGNAGTNQQYYMNPTDVGTPQSGRTPGGFNFEDYPGNNVGFGGIATPGAVTAGGDGYAVLTFYRSSGVFVKLNGSFQRVKHKMKIGGVIRNKVSSWVKVNGQWHPVNSNSDLNFQIDQTNWGDPGLARYIPPPPPPPYVYYGGGGGWGGWGGFSSCGGGFGGGDGGGGGGTSCGGGGGGGGD